MDRVDEGARGGDCARVRLPIIITPDRTALIGTWHTRTGPAGTRSSAVASGGATVPLARASSHPLSTSSTSSHHVCRHSASAQIQSVGVPPSDSMPYSQGHSLDSVMEMVATAAGTTVSDVVGMIGTVAGPSVQNAAMKVQWYRPTSRSSSEPCHLLLLVAPTGSTRQTCRPSPERVYASLAPNAPSRSATTSQGTRFSSTTPLQSRSPPPDRRSPCAWARKRVFLVGMLGPSWFVALEALHNSGHVLTTRGTGLPGSSALGPKSGVTSGSPRKRGGALAEGLAGGEKQQLQEQQQQQQQSRQQTTHPLLADLGPESVQDLFDASVIQFSVP